MNRRVCDMMKNGTSNRGVNGVQTILSIILLIASIVITVAVTLMQSKQQGLGVIDGGANLYGQSSMSKDRVLNRVIIGTGVVFMVAALAMAFVS